MFYYQPPSSSPIFHPLLLSSILISLHKYFCSYRCLDWLKYISVDSQTAECIGLHVNLLFNNEIFIFFSSCVFCSSCSILTIEMQGTMMDCNFLFSSGMQFQTSSPDLTFSTPLHSFWSPLLGLCNLTPPPVTLDPTLLDDPFLWTG